MYTHIFIAFSGLFIDSSTYVYFWRNRNEVAEPQPIVTPCLPVRM